jgi:hypothetical protein
VLPQAKGRILAVGSTWVPNNSDPCNPDEDTVIVRTDLVAARFNRNGSLDHSFGSGGVATFDLGIGVGPTFLYQPTARTKFDCEDPQALSLLPRARLVVAGINDCEEEEEEGFAAGTLTAFGR